MKTRSAPFRSVLLSLFAGASFIPAFAPGQDDQVQVKDFSKTNSVTLSLAEARRRNDPGSAGLRHAFWERDGRTTVLDVQGVACRSLSLTEDGRPKGYLYFAIDPSFKEQDVSKVRIEVEYFDGFGGQEGVFGVQYDATGSADASGFPSKQILPNVPLKGSGKWLKAVFHIRDATFQNAQNSRSDFRLWASPPELSVSRVTVTLEPQAPAVELLKFDAAGEAKLREWNVQWDSADKPSFSRQTNTSDGLRWLQIRASGRDAVGSWRTAPLLEAGEYQFVGKVRTEGSPGAPGTVTLRASGRGGYRPVAAATEWTALTYDFAMPALGYVELICEFRGVQGNARFDLDSLKLIRRNQAPK